MSTEYVREEGFTYADREILKTGKRRDYHGYSVIR